MPGRLTMRWYDHKAYTVVLDQQETAAFLIAAHEGWELRVRPADDLARGDNLARRFDRLGDARGWLRSDEGMAWLGRHGPHAFAPVPRGASVSQEPGVVMPAEPCWTCGQAKDSDRHPAEAGAR